MQRLLNKPNVKHEKIGLDLTYLTYGKQSSASSSRDGLCVKGTSRIDCWYGLLDITLNPIWNFEMQRLLNKPNVKHEKIGQLSGTLHIVF